MTIAYKKSLKTLTITLVDGSTVTAADTVDAPIGSSALAQFEDFQTIVVPGESATTYIPFHAVLKIEVAVEESEEQTRDPYGC